MTARTWVYKRLTTSPSLISLIGGDDPRVFAKKSMTSSVEETPYLVYKLGYSTDEGISESLEINRQFLQVFVHDFSDNKTGDYTRIDAVIRELKIALKLQDSPEDGVITCLYLETSQDLNDETLGTVMRYVRFQLITKEI